MPSRKILTLLSLCIVFVGLVFLLSYKNKDTGIIRVANLSNVAAPVSEIDNLDTDKDGVNDWEEVLWGTDINKTDTDDNGIKDKEEIEIKKKTNSKVSTSPTAPSLLAGETLTSKVGKDIVTQYLSLKQGGQTDSATLQNLGQQISASIKLPYTAKAVSLKDFSVITNNSKSDLLDYSNGIVDIYENLNLNPSEFKYEVLINPAHPEFRRSFIKLAEAYEYVGDEIKKQPVPSGLSAVALAMVHKYYLTASYIRNLSEIENDPILVIESIKKIKESEEEIEKLNINLQEYLSSRGIIFSETLNKFITQ